MDLLPIVAGSVSLLFHKWEGTIFGDERGMQVVSWNSDVEICKTRRRWLSFFNIHCQGNESYTGIAARDTASALRVLTAAARGVAATADERALQMNLIKATQAVVAESAKLIQEAKSAVNNPGDPNNQPRLAQVRVTAMYEHRFLGFV